MRLEAGTYSVGDIIRETESQTKYLFVYASKSFDISKKVQITGGLHEVSGLLDLITKDEWLYEVRRRYIVIIDEPTGPEEDPVPTSSPDPVEVRKGTEFPVSVSPRAKERTYPRPAVTPEV